MHKTVLAALFIVSFNSTALADSEMDALKALQEVTTRAETFQFMAEGCLKEIREGNRGKQCNLYSRTYTQENIDEYVEMKHYAAAKLDEIINPKMIEKATSYLQRALAAESASDSAAKEIIFLISE